MTYIQEWYLRRASGDDVERLHMLLCIPEVYRYLLDGVAPSRSRIEEWIKSSYTDEAASSSGLWMLENNKGQLAGCVSLEMQNQLRSAELVYLLHPQFWGQGLATRMSWTVMQRAFKEGHVDQIVAGTDGPNTASVAVMRRLGMKFLRTVEYPLGPGVEYVYQHGDPPPVRLPATIPFIE